MIRNFRNRALRDFWATDNPRGLSVQNSKRVRIMLQELNLARRPEDMNISGYYFHRIGRGVWSLRVTGNWRLTFGWAGEDATDVDLTDYH